MAVMPGRVNEAVDASLSLLAGIIVAWAIFSIPAVEPTPPTESALQAVIGALTGTGVGAFVFRCLRGRST